MKKLVQAVLTPNGKPGEAWPTPLMAPIGSGESLSALPILGGVPPVNVTGGDPQPKLGLGTANPTVHGGG